MQQLFFMPGIGLRIWDSQSPLPGDNPGWPLLAFGQFTSGAPSGAGVACPQDTLARSARRMRTAADVQFLFLRVRIDKSVQLRYC